MSNTKILGIVLVFFTTNFANGQSLREREEEFLRQAPLIGEPLPDVGVFRADGTLFNTAELRGSYAVLTFGCMTCPPSMWAIPGLEAVHRDYVDQGVNFFFIYKSLAHPELAGRFVQPFTQEERLAHAQLAQQRLGTKIPWIVDAIDNRLKHALGDRPNSQFIVDPKGVVIHKSAWSNPEKVREVLAEHVGPVEKITRVEDLEFPAIDSVKRDAVGGVGRLISREGMQAIEAIPEKSDLPYLAKLRVEADDKLLRSGRGTLYIGFHLDPIHDAHWNNLASPLSYEFDLPANVRLEPISDVAQKVDSATDEDPREFLIRVANWPSSESIGLTVRYHACDHEGTCHSIQQSYQLKLVRDKDAGGARGEWAGFWQVDEFTQRMLACDVDGDKVLDRSEAPGLILPHFGQIDLNSDGRLQRDELEAVTDWVNRHHQAGPPKH